MTTDLAVTLRHISLGYGSDAKHGVVAARDLSFDVHHGERVVVIGPSGCGKTTLLKAVGGFLTPLEGEITFGDGRRMSSPHPDCVLVFQEFDQLFPWLTVAKNISRAMWHARRTPRAEATKKATEVLDLMGIGYAANRYPHELSGGMKQRGAIARALALGPHVLLMDEPFGSLDAITRERLQQELVNVCRRTQVTLLFVTHSIAEAILIGHRIVVLGGTPSTVLEEVDVSAVDDPGSAAGTSVAQHLSMLLHHE